MAIDFSKINLEVIDINTNADPDIYINQNGITFSKRVLEDLNYPQNVQYAIDPAQYETQPLQFNGEQRGTGHRLLQASCGADHHAQLRQQESEGGGREDDPGLRSEEAVQGHRRV